jgi:addiction module HigA family antidote
MARAPQSRRKSESSSRYRSFPCRSNPYGSPQEIGWRRSAGTDEDNIASESTTNTAFAFDGLQKALTWSRLLTTIETTTRVLLMIRIPTHGPPTHPGEMLREEFLEPLGLSQMDLAQKLGVSYPRVNELIHGKRGVTPDTALRLERLFGMEAQFWLNLQLAWDLYQTKHSPASKEIAKVKPLARSGKGR